MTRVVLIGNPNCGKTTLFNALTGDNQRVGNWPGVTVEKKTGELIVGGHRIELTDLPGVYSLVANAQGLSQDEQIAAEAIVAMDPDCIINVVDACHLERHLYLTSQILELGKPMILALNMMDVAQQRGIVIDLKYLEQQLGFPVIALQAHKHIGISQILEALMAIHKANSPLVLPLSPAVAKVLANIEKKLLVKGYSNSLAYYYARRYAEEDTLAVNDPMLDGGDQSTRNDLGLDVVLADARYQKVHEIVTCVQHKKSDASEHFTAKLDRIVLNRFLALPIFFVMMYMMFSFAINIGGAIQDYFDVGTEAVFVHGSAWLLQQLQAPNWLIAIIANGLGRGINTTLTFIPVIAAMYFFLSLLETSGYMARAAFVVDKVMRAMGLPGKSFVPMIVGFGCNVPAIMSARTLDSERDRLLTIIMSPFMSCSARLAIYAVFVAAFFPNGGQNIVFCLYFIGILLAVFTGFLLRKTILKGHASPLILELPAYHKPSIKRLLKETSTRLRFFVVRAGKLIIPICVILGGLNAITLGGGLNSGDANTQSLLSLMGQWITPFFAPMGIHQDNWPATVGLLTGMLAKEVVIGTLNSLYSQVGHLGEAGVTQTVYGMMAQSFDGQAGAFAYLLFVLLYIPCVSTMAVIRQEANTTLMWTSIIWSLVIAYASAVVFYQAARFVQHPQESIFWISLMVLMVISVIGIFALSQRRGGGKHALTNT